MNKRNFLGISLASIACLSALVMIYNNQDLATRNAQKEKPDVFMTEAHYTEFNKHGILHSTLFTPSIKHYNKQNMAEFDHPKMMIYTDQRIPWYISSNYGKSYDGTERILLSGDVILHQPQKPSHPKTTMLTETLTVYPNKSYAETDQKVTIKQPGSLIKGKGLQVNMKTGTAKILTHATGNYDPEKQNEGVEKSDAK